MGQVDKGAFLEVIIACGDWNIILTAVSGPDCHLFNSRFAFLIHMVFLGSVRSGSVRCLSHQEGQMDPSLGYDFGTRAYPSTTWHGGEKNSFCEGHVCSHLCETCVYTQHMPSYSISISSLLCLLVGAAVNKSEYRCSLKLTL